MDKQYFNVSNIFRTISLVAYMYLMLNASSYKFITNYDESYVILALSAAALITIISFFRPDLFDVKFNLPYNFIIGAGFARLGYSVYLLETQKVDEVFVTPWFKLRRIWTPQEYIDMFLEKMQKINFDISKITPQFRDQVSKSRSIGDLERYKAILLDQQKSAINDLSAIDYTLAFKYIAIAVVAVVGLYFAYHSVNLVFNQDAVNKDVAEKLAGTDKAVSILRQDTIAATQDLNDKIADLAKSLEKTHASGQGLRMAVEELKTLTGDAVAQMTPLLSSSNAIKVMVHAFALESLESGDPQLINKALDSLRNYFTISLKMVNEHIAKARLIADGNIKV